MAVKNKSNTLTKTVVDVPLEEADVVPQEHVENAGEPVVTEVSVQTSEEQNVLSTHASEAAKITLDEYLARFKVNPGLVASFSYEARNTSGGLEPREEHEWAQGLLDQSNRTYEGV